MNKNKNSLSFTYLVQTDGMYNTRVVAVSEQGNLQICSYVSEAT
jgi:hypothetical protein